MFIEKDRIPFSERQKSPLQNHNYNRPGRRILAVRRVDQASLKKHVVPPRKADIPRKEWNKYENRLFDTDLKAWQDEEQLPPYQDDRVDHRYDIPYQNDRVSLGRRKNLPRRVRREEFVCVSETQRINGKAARERLRPLGRE